MDIRLSQGTRYAIQALEFMAWEQNGDWMDAHRMSQELGIPRLYLAKIFTHLSQAGIVDSRKGRSGGFRLEKNWESIPLERVVGACEKIGMQRVCMLDGRRCTKKTRPCRVHPLWLQIHAEIRDLLHQTTLADILQKGGLGIHG